MPPARWPATANSCGPYGGPERRSDARGAACSDFRNSRKRSADQREQHGTTSRRHARRRPGLFVHRMGASKRCRGVSGAACIRFPQFPQALRRSARTTRNDLAPARPPTTGTFCTPYGGQQTLPGGERCGLHRFPQFPQPLRRSARTTRNGLASARSPTTGTFCTPYGGQRTPPGVSADAASSNAGAAGRSFKRATMMPILPKKAVDKHTPQHCSGTSSAGCAEILHDPPLPPRANARVPSLSPRDDAGGEGA